ncbi:hypothetical protein AB4090_05775 [Acidithiobacillus sp. IBUN Pt1247-S3]|uniref:hypothetical protein n=1 Tax=Acidithiobacillus sp. IBUN Pt1247-S3 TaxID=3166642 RepID=UPI0034E4D2DB
MPTENQLGVRNSYADALRDFTNDKPLSRKEFGLTAQLVPVQCTRICRVPIPNPGKYNLQKHTKKQQ